MVLPSKPHSRDWWGPSPSSAGIAIGSGNTADWIPRTAFVGRSISLAIAFFLKSLIKSLVKRPLPVVGMVPIFAEMELELAGGNGLFKTLRITRNGASYPLRMNL